MGFYSTNFLEVGFSPEYYLLMVRFFTLLASRTLYKYEKYKSGWKTDIRVHTDSIPAPLTNVFGVPEVEMHNEPTRSE